MPRFSALLLSAALIASVQGPNAARADEGILEINQACAAIGCFAGDGAGFPVTITASGSYRLTSSLLQTTTGGSPTPVDAIVIEASDVTLDMRGFSIACNETTSGACPGSADGIRANLLGQQALFVHNGIVHDMPGDGFQLTVAGVHAKNLIARDNGGEGIRVGSAIGTSNLVESCTATGNGSNGIAIGPTSIIRGCISNSNSGAALVGLSVFGGTFSGYTGCATLGTISDLTDLGANFP